MNHHFLSFLYGFTMFLAALLLFAVQPMFSKMILPHLGGSPQVWNTSMFFFQTMLLCGYGYAHLTSKYLKIRTQIILHTGLLALFLLVLPLSLPENIQTTDLENAAFWQIGLMLTTVGGPFFVLSGSAPMIQRWFSGLDHPNAHNPYFLYAISNLGSMAALLSYPLWIEPLMTLTQQSYNWELGYRGLIVVIAALFVISRFSKTEKETSNHEETNISSKPPWKSRIYWIALAFIPSSLMLGVTTFITVDIASLPLFWVLPLAIYVGTFVLAFAQKQYIHFKDLSFWQALLILFIVIQMFAFETSGLYMLPVHLLLFFVSALMCHKALAASKPDVEHLTEFYLFIAFGGVLGGLLNAIIAPLFFIVPIEYALILALSTFFRSSTALSFEMSKKTMATLIINALILSITFLFKTPLLYSILSVSIFISGLLLIESIFPFAILVTLIFIIFPPGGIEQITKHQKTLMIDRSFFGVIKVQQTDKMNLFLHGTTLHGTQAIDPKYETYPLSYYNPEGVTGDIFHILNTHKTEQNIAVLGLGIGSVACYSQDKRTFAFYEIDPLVLKTAQDERYFTYLSKCGSPYTVTLGDARLELNKEQTGIFDMIFMDTFSSDNIPIHLLTKEAFQIYFDKLKPEGMIAINISNRYLDLRAVLAAIAEELNKQALYKFTPATTMRDTELPYTAAVFVTMTNNKEQIEFLKSQGWEFIQTKPSVRAWTDQYSNIFHSLLRKKKNK